MSQPSMTQPQFDVALASYERCQRSPEFFRVFYEKLLASDPSIPPMFAKTSFDRQHRLLQHGLGLLLSYGRRPNPSLLERIAERHGPTDLNIAEHLYPLFLESLIETVRGFDPEFSPGVEHAWRASLAPGATFMQRFRR